MEPTYPSRADLTVEGKPAPGVEIVTSERAAAEYDAAIEGWGERGWRAVARLCRYFAGHGMDISCPAAPVDQADD